MRRAINVLQAASAMGKVTIETVYKVVGMARPREVREMLKQALSGDFTGARNLMRKLMLEYGLSGEDIVRQVHREIFSQEVNIPEELRVMSYCGLRSIGLEH
jgi:replication factor C small subunit